MRNHTRFMSLPALLASTLLVAARAQASWSHDPNVNLAIAPSTASQNHPAIATDMAGGCYVAWADFRAGNLDIYLQRITADGNVAPGWPASGLAVCTQPGNQSNTSVASDGAGGVFVAWDDARISPGDRDIFLAHVQASGALAPGSPAGGLDLSTFTGKDEAVVHLAADGSGGVWAVWTLFYTPGTDDDVYGAHVTGAGGVTFSGAVNGPTNLQDNPAVVVDGSGNALVACASNDGGGVIVPWQAQVVKVNATGLRLMGPASVSSPAIVAGDHPQIVSDAAGGCYIVCTFSFSGSDNLCAQHFTGSGAIAPGFWAGNARSVASFSSPTYMAYPRTCSDGAGGLLVAWSDQRYGPGNYYAFIQRFLPSGYLPAGWPVNGLALGAADRQFVNGLAPDGTGGAVATWIDQRVTTGEYYATRITGAGLRAAGWGSNGNPLGTACSSPDALDVIPDGRGGVIATFTALRADPHLVYAQTLDAFGQLGDVRPGLAKPRDVAADQGGFVRLAWNASWLDQPASLAIAQYWIWRQTPLTAAEAAVARGSARWLGAPEGEAALAPEGATQLLRHADDAAANFAWEYLAALGTDGSAQYSYVATTTSDSIAGHNPQTVFMVEARGVWPGTFWDSAPDSGYSVDNLPPATPAPFTGQYAVGSTRLHWDRNLESDFAGYRLYRGNSPSFTPSGANRISSQPDTGFVDSPGAPYVYKLSAVDVHGNESGYATLVPSGTLAVGPDAPRELALAEPGPNPSRGDARVTYVLPRAGVVRLALYDAAGRRVRTLASSREEVGVHELAFTLRDDAGRALPDGLYWLRLETEGGTLARKLLAMR
jgi:hypothetical protein